MLNTSYIVVLGGGESGTGAAILAKKEGMQVFLSDSGTIADKYKKVLKEKGIEFEENGQTEERILSAGEVVKSPGIPDNAPLILKLKENHINVISEIEFATRYTTARLIGITGTNGKTTTTLLTYHLLKEAGLNVGLAGNVGYSLAQQVAEENYDFYVIELSSFQLDGMYNTMLDAGVLLNITPDHLNRYDNSFEKYIISKFRIANNMNSNCCLIYNSDDAAIRNYLDTSDNKFITKALSTNDTNANAWFQNEALHFNHKGEILSIGTEELNLKGRHNYGNMMAAVTAALFFDVDWSKIQTGLKTFKPVEHRLEFVAEINEVKYYNDSKATNVDAVWYALDSFYEKIVWIAGGVDKGNDYAQLFGLAGSRVKALVALGTDNSVIEKAFNDRIGDIRSTSSMEEAVNVASVLANPGEVVLLSPACASFDLFKNYEDRGAQFKEAVRNIELKAKNLTGIQE